jgi:glycosyltransferase involved in cell wall biosynthesis
MLNNTKKIKVLLYGKFFRRDYRYKLLIKFLHESEYCISQVCPEFYRTNKNFLVRLCWIELFIKAAVADIIYLPPMNAKLIKSAILVSRIFNKKLVVEMYISLYDTYVRDRKLIKDGSKEARFWMEKDILALTKSDYIIHTASEELTYWEKILGINIDRSKVFIAPNCNVSTPVIKRKFMQDGILKICWWGTFIPLHGLDKILQAMKILKEHELQFTCTLLGVDNPHFYTYAEKIQLDNLEQHVVLRKDLSFPDGSLPKYLIDNCDLALGIFGDTDKARYAVPNKLIEALAMESPTLTMNSPGLREFFNPETDLWTCEPSPKSIAETILTITGGVAYPVDWKQTRQKVLNTFSVARYQEAVNKVLGRVTDNLVRGETSDLESGVFETHQAALNQVKR